MDKRALRRAFDRLAEDYLAEAQVQSEICRRMLARLELVRIEPSVILDVGAGPGLAARELTLRYPKATVVALDVSWRMLREIAQPGRLARWFRVGRPPSVAPLCADFERMPLARASTDCVVSNLALSWSDDIGRVIEQVHGVLKPGGLFMFTTLGPDTLREWRRHGPNAQLTAHLMDMHDLGDALVHQGFSGPVMDQEHLWLTYSHPSKLLRDLKGWGALDMSVDRRRALGGRLCLDAFMGAGAGTGEIGATLEVIHGHAWKPQGDAASARLPDGRSVIRFDRALRKP